MAILAVFFSVLDHSGLNARHFPSASLRRQTGVIKWSFKRYPPLTLLKLRCTLKSPGCYKTGYKKDIPGIMRNAMMALLSFQKRSLMRVSDRIGDETIDEQVPRGTSDYFIVIYRIIDFF